MLKPACVSCGMFFRPAKNGVLVAENKPKFATHVPPGNVMPEMWTGYKIWCADKWKCPGCNTEIIVGYGAEPIQQDYRPGFKEAHAKVQIQINDC